MRNPKLNPLPGDEFLSTVLKAKVVNIVLTDNGVESVCVAVGYKDKPYPDKGTMVKSLAEFVTFVNNNTTKVTNRATLKSLKKKVCGLE